MDRALHPGERPDGESQAAAAKAAESLDRFFDRYYARRPVNASFIGVHEHDGSWPDCSEAGLGDWLAETRTLKSELDASGTPADPDVAWDLRLASGFLETQAWELSSGHGPLGNPAFFTGEAAFGLIALLLTDYAPLARRVQCLNARLAGLPDFLAQGGSVLRSAPRAWTTRASRECGALVALLERGLPMARESWLGDGCVCAAEAHVSRAALDAFDTGRAAALEAAGRFHEVLRELPDAGDQAASAGPEAMTLHLERAHFLDRALDDWIEAATARTPVGPGGGGAVAGTSRRRGACGW